MRQNRQNERERGGMGGIRVCDCQQWERDPPGGMRVQEKGKKEQKIFFLKKKKREQVSREMGGKRREETRKNVGLM